MSELKVASCFEFEKVLSGKSNKLFYAKSEADKVIAELKSDIADLRDDKKLTDAILDERNAEIVELKKACNDKDDWCLHTLKENRHQKYKRCLAMAKSCKNCAEMFGCMASHERLKFGKTPYYQKCSLHANIQICHEKKWLELAEKFKPNNSTAQ